MAAPKVKIVDLSRSNVDVMLHDVAKALVSASVVKAYFREQSVLPTYREAMAALIGLGAWHLGGRQLIDRMNIANAIEDTLGL